jgi:hypothetical protein
MSKELERALDDEIAFLQKERERLTLLCAELHKGVCSGYQFIHGRMVKAEAALSAVTEERDKLKAEIERGKENQKDAGQNRP